jgi:hypothetical protein
MPTVPNQLVISLSVASRFLYTPCHSHCGFRMFCLNASFCFRSHNFLKGKIICHVWCIAALLSIVVIVWSCILHTLEPAAPKQHEQEWRIHPEQVVEVSYSFPNGQSVPSTQHFSTQIIKKKSCLFTFHVPAVRVWIRQTFIFFFCLSQS